MTDTVLIVDDEDSVRRTFVDWLSHGELGVRVLSASDAEAALRIANETSIDLAVLDWHLGTGSDGLRLLEDLVEFQPDIVAILVTGYANQATPLDALRMGVRDYLDKNQDLTRDRFLAAISRQLDKVRPAKRQRELNLSLAAFRDAVEQILPMVRSTAALNDSLPLPSAVHALMRFVLRATGATDGAIVVRQFAADGSDTAAAYGPDGSPLPLSPVPFAQSLAAGVVSMNEPCAMNNVDAAGVGSLALFPFETGRKTILAAPLRVGPGIHVVLELFDKPTFSDDDKKLAAAAADIGAELLRHALAHKQTHRLLFDAVEAALSASENVTQVLESESTAPAPHAAAMERLKQGLGATANEAIDAETGLKLIEAVRGLAVRHGPTAVAHCIAVIDSLRTLLDETTGTA